MGRCPYLQYQTVYVSMLQTKEYKKRTPYARCSIVESVFLFLLKKVSGCFSFNLHAHHFTLNVEKNLTWFVFFFHHKNLCHLFPRSNTHGPKYECNHIHQTKPPSSTASCSSSYAHVPIVGEFSHELGLAWAFGLQ